MADIRLTQNARVAGPKTPQEVLDFWFGNAITASDDGLAQFVVHWFKATAAFDREIADAFGTTIESAAAGALDQWCATPHGRLALIVVLDQFTRNVFRGTPRAFACDLKAQALCVKGLAEGADLALTPVERHFFYLPLLHAEDRAMQDLSLSCFKKLAEIAPPHQRDHFAACLSASVRYRDVVSAFGRFPHRNAIVGRESSNEELLFIERGRLA